MDARAAFDLVQDHATKTKEDWYIPTIGQIEAFRREKPDNWDKFDMLSNEYAYVWALDDRNMVHVGFCPASGKICNAVNEFGFKHVPERNKFFVLAALEVPMEGPKS